MLSPRCEPPIGKWRFPTEGKSSIPLPTVISPTLDIGRAYNAKEAAAILGITPYVLNERVREGWVQPMFETGDRRSSGYVLAQLLGWPLADKARRLRSMRQWRWARG